MSLSNSHLKQKQLRKDLIAQRFLKAEQTYTQHALIQKNMSEHLCQLMLKLCPPQLPKVLEIGCGSGNLTGQVVENFSIDHLYLNDLYEQVKQFFLVKNTQSTQYPPIVWCIGDIEKQALENNFSAIISSSALQWMSHLQLLLQRLYTACMNHGYLCFSTFGPENLFEIKALTGQGLHYWSLDDWQRELTQCGFNILTLTEEKQYLYFNTAKDVLKHLKATGVTATTATDQRWTRQNLHQFYADYEQFKQQDGRYCLTYHPIYCIARKEI